MNTFLTKIAIRKAVGLYLGEHEVTVCKVAGTLLGPVVVASGSEPCTPENVADVIERLLVPLLGSKRNVPVAVGLAGSRIFYGTRLTPSGGEIRPEAELQKALYSSNLSADDLVVDLLRGTVNKMPVARMAACRTKYMTNVVAILNRLRVRPVRAEPAACALARLAEQQYRPPRRSKAILRVFLGDTQGLAVVVAAGLPLAWKTFALMPGMEGFAIISATRGLKTQQVHYGIESPLEFAMIHGRADLHEDLKREQLPTEMGTRVVWNEGPTLDGATMARGLAEGCLSPDIKAFDLARTLKASPPIKEIFPYKEMVFAASLVACMGIVLAAHAMKLDESYLRLRAENGQHACLASANPEKLEKEKKAMQDKVDAVRRFLETRMQWTTYTSDISTRLPKNAVLTLFNGRNALDCGAKSTPSTGAFQLQGTAPLLQDGSISPEIDAFLIEIPNDPLWKRDFASVATDMKLPLGNKADRSGVTFSIVGRCKAGNAGGGKGTKAKGDAK